MLQEVEKNILAQKLLVFNVLAQTSKENKEAINQILDTWNKYLSLSYGVEVEKMHSLTEKTMLDEYEKIKHLRPEFKIGKNGEIIIKGFDSFMDKK